MLDSFKRGGTLIDSKALMQVIRQQYVGGHQKTLPSGEIRRYYLPHNDPLEVIETILPSGDHQSPHAHQMVREATWVLDGKVFVGEIVNGNRDEDELGQGDFVVFEPRSCHFMENRSKASARTLTFKYLGESKDTRLFATDKTNDCGGPMDSIPSGNRDQRFDSYIKLYNNLDNLLWQVPAFLGGVSGIGLALGGSFLANKESALPPFSHNQTVGGVMILLGLFYLIGVHAIWRIRAHHSLAGEQLARLEPQGYFSKRREITKRHWLWSAPHVFMFVFSVLAILLLALGAYLFYL